MSKNLFGCEIDDTIDIIENKKGNTYTKKIDAPIYEPRNIKPNIKSLINLTKTKKLIKEIESSSVSSEEKTFLKFAAFRHIVFSYQNIADYYAHSEKEMQELMEKSALVIIDFNKAIEYGYTKLSNDICQQYLEEYCNDEK